MNARPLGFLETALAVNYEFRPFNAVAVLELDGAIDGLRPAVDRLQNRHPALRARIIPGRRRRFSYDVVEPVPIRRVARRSEQTWLEVVNDELMTAMPNRGPLARVAVIGGDGRSELIATMHHAIGDAASIEHLVHDLLSDITGESLPTTALAIPPAADDLFPAGFRGPRLRLRRAAMLAAALPGEARYRWAMRRHGAFPISTGADQRALFRQLDRETTQRLSRRARRRRLTLHSVVQAAVLLSLHSEFYAPARLRLRTFAFGDLRPYVGGGTPAEPLACYMTMTWHDIEVGAGADLWTVAEAVQQDVYRRLKDGGKFVASAATQPLVGMTLGMKRFRMGNAALTYTGVSRLATSYGALRVRGLHGFVSNMGLGPEWAMRAGVHDGRLVLDITSLPADMSPAIADTVADAITSRLTTAA